MYTVKAPKALEGGSAGSGSGMMGLDLTRPDTALALALAAFLLAVAYSPTGQGAGWDRNRFAMLVTAVVLAAQVRDCDSRGV
jgi:hypothetical protein